MKYKVERKLKNHLSNSTDIKLPDYDFYHKFYDIYQLILDKNRRCCERLRYLL